MQASTSTRPSLPMQIQERLRRLDRDRLTGFLVILPSIILLGIFVYGFIGQTFYWSMTDWGKGTNIALKADVKKNYIGLENYEDLFTNVGVVEYRFRLGLVNTFFFTLFFMIGCLILGFLLAVLLDQNVRGEGVFRTIFLFPMALSFAASGTAWRWLFQPTGGVNVLPTLVGGNAFDNQWLNNNQPFRFHWHEVPLGNIFIIVALFLLFFVSYISRRRFLNAVYLGIPMVLFFLWILSDRLSWKSEWDALQPERNPAMHGTFTWANVAQFLSTALVIGFILFLINRLWHGKRRAAMIVAIPTTLLLLWYTIGGPDSLPALDRTPDLLPYGYYPALTGIVIAAVWQLSGYTMAMYLAGIRGVSEELREAARVDGCNEWQVYTRIVLPLLRPITLSAAIVLGHISLKIFDLIWAMAGPDRLVVSVPGLQVYTTFRSSTFAIGSAIATVLLILVAFIIVPYLITSLRAEHEV